MSFSVTCSKVDENIKQKHGVGDQIENKQTGMTHILVEKRNGNRQNDDIGDEQYQHDQVPVEAEVTAWMNDPVADLLLA